MSELGIKSWLVINYRQTDWESVKADRGLLIYLAWQLGVATNQQIGEKFGLTYSARSQRISVIKEMLNKDKELERKYRHINSLINIWHRSFRGLASPVYLRRNVDRNCPGSKGNPREWNTICRIKPWGRIGTEILRGKPPYHEGPELQPCSDKNWDREKQNITFWLVGFTYPGRIFQFRQITLQ